MTPHIGAFREHGKKPSKYAGSFKFRAGLIIAGTILVLALGHLLLVGGGGEVDVIQRRLPIGSPGFLLGTDQLGRDMVSRLLASIRWSFSVGLVAGVLTTAIGTTIGVIAGTSRGIRRILFSRLIDLAISFPELILAVTIIALIGRGFLPLALTLGFVSWPNLARVVFAETLSLMTRDYVTASRLSGARQRRIVFSHILPGLRSTLLVMFAFIFADLLVAESGLSFLGLGALLGEPSLGSMLADGRKYLFSSPTLILLPCLAIVLAVSAANLIGDGLAARLNRGSR